MKESKKRKKERTLAIIEGLKDMYPVPECSLEHTDPYHLLVSVRLAAQCTDARVNIVTPSLFARFPTPEAMKDADFDELCDLIHSTGFFRSKARDLILCAEQLCLLHDGKVPSDMKSLLALAGVGRKSANLILGDVYNKPAVVTDTHCLRICMRLGLTDTKVPHKAEMQLWELLPPEESNDFCHRTVMHGRAVCTARKAMCENCTLTEICLQL